MPRIPLLSWIGNAAAVLFGKRGDVTAQTQQAGCSRQTAYAHADKVQRAVAQAQTPGPDRDTLLHRVEDLRGLVRDLQRQLRDQRRQRDDRVALGRPKQRRAAVALHAMGLSLNQIEDAFGLLLPKGRAPDRSTIGHWVRQAQRQATAVLSALDVGCQKRAEQLCADEIFFGGRPCLVGVEPCSMALLVCQRAADRTAATWRKALEPFARLGYVCADAGKGLQAALLELDGQRRQQGQPPLERGLDHFHIGMEAQKILARTWSGVEARWAAAEEADRQRAKALDKGRDGRGPAARARAAWKRAFDAMAWYDRWADAWQQVRQALALVKPDGSLNDRASAQAAIARAWPTLRGRVWKKVGDFLSDRRTLTFLDRVHRQLAEAEPRAEVRAALWRLWGLERAAARRRQAGGGAFLAAVVVQRVVCAKLAADWAQSYRRVGAVLSGCVRASSAVECINSVLRMQQGRQRRMSQGMLDLKRLYWNCRRFKSGPRRDRCPYQLLGLTLPTYDFWELLHMNPAQLAQEPSTTEVAA